MKKDDLPQNTKNVFHPLKAFAEWPLPQWHSGGILQEAW
jgi:hypothetical protein